jgi:hypothetical protein
MCLAPWNFRGEIGQGRGVRARCVFVSGPPRGVITRSDERTLAQATPLPDLLFQFLRTRRFVRFGFAA